MIREEMFFIKENIEKRLASIEAHRYRERMIIDELRMQEENGDDIAPNPPTDGLWRTLRHLDFWSGRDRYVWLRAEVSLPDEWYESTIVGRFDFGKTGEGYNSGFESLLYVNGKPQQGVDTNHQEIFLESSYAGQTVELAFRLWSGLEGGGEQKLQHHQFQMAEIALLNEEVDDFCFLASHMLKTVRYLRESDPERRPLLQLLNKAIHRVDFDDEGSPAFFQSVQRGAEYLSTELEKIPRRHEATVNCIGHTHIDVAWLWRLKHTREKVLRSFSTVLHLMERYPDFIFFQSQPQLYEFIKEDAPELYAAIKERVAEGRFETGGAMWVEADCNIPSGESLIRQILFGHRFFNEEFGIEQQKFLWLPDVFGYSWALPQILKLAGIETFVTSKISWNQYNRLPHDTFRWRGIDGSEVVTHMITTPESEEQNPSSWQFTYNGTILPGTIKGTWDRYRDKEINDTLFLPYGYGDGGGGVNRDMLEGISRLAKMPGMPVVKTARLDETLAEIRRNINETEEYVHTWDGELYLEFHRGTYTSQAHNKKMNRYLELLCREAEMNGVRALLTTSSTSHITQLNRGWKILLRNQFHDIIPGSSIREVYEESAVEYGEAERIITRVNAEALQQIIKDSANTYTVFNHGTTTRKSLVLINGGVTTGEWVLHDGRRLKTQQTASKTWVLVPDVPGLGYTTLHFSPTEEEFVAAKPFSYSGNVIETPWHTVEISDEGTITRLFDKHNRREVVRNGDAANQLQLFEDKPREYDAWELEISYRNKVKNLGLPESVVVKESGELFFSLEFTWCYHDRTTIVQEMIFYVHTPRIDFKTWVDWHERDTLLKAAFPVNVRSTFATYDIQCGNLQRPTHWNTSWDMARFEVCAHQWVDLSEGGYGVALMSDCKYGYDVKNNILRISLLKSSTFPDREQDQGNHSFVYALFPHSNDFKRGGVVEEAYNLNKPFNGVAGSTTLPSRRLVIVDRTGIVVDAVKSAEDGDGVIVRLHECYGIRSSLLLTSDYPISAWREVDILERPLSDLQNTSEIAASIKPYEIKNFRLLF